MVEAAIIFPVIVVFLGLMEYAHAEYVAKIQTYNDARYAVWTNVVHATCTGSGQDLGQAASTKTGGASTPDQSHQPTTVTGGTQQRFLIKKFTQSAKASASITRGQATYTNNNITSQSSVYCNEPKNNATNILGQVWSFAKGF